MNKTYIRTTTRIGIKGAIRIMHIEVKTVWLFIWKDYELSFLGGKGILWIHNFEKVFIPFSEVKKFEK